MEPLDRLVEERSNGMTNAFGVRLCDSSPQNTASGATALEPDMYLLSETTDPFRARTRAVEHGRVPTIPTSQLGALAPSGSKGALLKYFRGKLFKEENFKENN